MPSKNVNSEPIPNKIGANNPQNIISIIPALGFPVALLIIPYKKGDGKYPNAFLMIYPLELPNDLISGGTDAIIIPVSPGTIAPPKNKTSQRRIETGQKKETKGIITAAVIPTTPKMKMK